MHHSGAQHSKRAWKILEGESLLRRRRKDMMGTYFLLGKVMSREAFLPFLSAAATDSIEKYSGRPARIPVLSATCDSVAAAVASKRKGERRGGISIALVRLEAGSILGCAGRVVFLHQCGNSPNLSGTDQRPCRNTVPTRLSPAVIGSTIALFALGTIGRHETFVFSHAFPSDRLALASQAVAVGTYRSAIL